MATSTITQLAPTQVELVIPISDEELRAAEERAFRRLAKNARLPGFRPGKVPRRVFEQAYGSETIASQAIEDVVPEVYAKAVREHDIDPVDRPHMELLREGDGPLTGVKAVVDVRPQIALGAYKGVEVERPATTVSDEDVEHALQRLARDRGTLVPVEREARLGDVVTIDYAGTIDGEPFEGGTATGAPTELEEGRFIPGFAAGIAGMQVGEHRDVEATFPENYAQQDLAGKKAVFAVTLHEVKELELPTIDDEFAKNISSNENLDALRADIRRRIGLAAEARARREVGNRIVDRLVESHEVPLPGVMVERETESMLEEAASMAQRMGMSFEDYLKAVEKSEDDLRAEFQSEAQRRVKAALILEAIAKAENITATPADIQNELQSLARQYGEPVDRIRAALGNNVLSLMDGIVRNKTVEFLVEHAAATEATPGGSS